MSGVRQPMPPMPYYVTVTGTQSWTFAAPQFVGHNRVIVCSSAASMPAGTITLTSGIK